MERLHYVEIQIKRTEYTLKRIARTREGIWMVKPLEDYLRTLKHEKRYWYSRMMKEKVY